MAVSSAEFFCVCVAFIAISLLVLLYIALYGPVHSLVPPSTARTSYLYIVFALWSTITIRM